MKPKSIPKDARQLGARANRGFLGRHLCTESVLARFIVHRLFVRTGCLREAEINFRQIKITTMRGHLGNENQLQSCLYSGRPLPDTLAQKVRFQYLLCRVSLLDLVCQAVRMQFLQWRQYLPNVFSDLFLLATAVPLLGTVKPVTRVCWRGGSRRASENLINSQSVSYCLTRRFKTSSKLCPIWWSRAGHDSCENGRRATRD